MLPRYFRHTVANQSAPLVRILLPKKLTPPDCMQLSDIQLHSPIYFFFMFFEYSTILTPLRSDPSNTPASSNSRLHHPELYHRSSLDKILPPQAFLPRIAPSTSGTPTPTSSYYLRLHCFLLLTPPSGNSFQYLLFDFHTLLPSIDTRE